MLYPSSVPRPATLEELMPGSLLAGLDRLDVLSRKVFAGKLPGERRSKKRGQSVEFDDYRDYVPGDDLRHIDWNVFARLDRFFVKLFREEEDLALHLVLDASASMDAGGDAGDPAARPSKLIFAQRLAVALAYIGLVNQNRVVVSVIGAPGRPLVQQLAPLRGRGQMPRVARFILDRVGESSAAMAPPDSEPPESEAGPLTRALRQIASSRGGRGVLFLMSDLLVRENLPRAFNYLARGGGPAGGGAAGGFDTAVIQILSPGELDPSQEPGGALIGDLRLTDAESGRASEVTVSTALLARYRARLADHLESVRTAASARGMTHAVVRSDADLRGLLMGYLRRRGLLG